MALADITPDAVREAMKEYDRLGRNIFLQRYGFGKARNYFVRVGDREYDSKAILGVAHKYVAAGEESLTADSFSGGDEHAGRILIGMGFDVVKHRSPGAGAHDALYHGPLVLVENEVKMNQEHD